MLSLRGFGNGCKPDRRARNICNDRVHEVSPIVYSWAELRRILASPLRGAPVEFHIVRHGESTANLQGVVAGKANVDLSLKGCLQSLALGLRLQQPYDHAWTSSLRRSRKTLGLAKVLRPQLTPHCTTHCDARIDERGLGVNEGLPRSPIPAYAAGDLLYAPKGGESYLDLTQRVMSFLIDIRRTICKPNRVVVSTHAGPMRVLVGILEGMSDSRSVLALSFDNTKIHCSVLTDLTWPAFVPHVPSERYHIAY